MILWGHVSLTSLFLELFTPVALLVPLLLPSAVNQIFKFRFVLLYRGWSVLILAKLACCSNILIILMATTERLVMYVRVKHTDHSRGQFLSLVGGSARTWHLLIRKFNAWIWLFLMQIRWRETLSSISVLSIVNLVRCKLIYSICGLDRLRLVNYFFHFLKSSELYFRLVIANPIGLGDFLDFDGLFLCRSGLCRRFWRFWCKFCSLFNFDLIWILEGSDLDIFAACLGLICTAITIR